MTNDPARKHAEPPTPTNPVSPQAQDMAAKVTGAQLPVNLIDPATLQTVMAMMMPVMQTMLDANRETTMAAVAEMRKPSEEEQKKIDAELARIKNARIQAAKTGEMEANIIKQQRAGCGHIKPNGMHTFGGQVFSNGWAVIKCQRCYVEFNVRPLPEQIASGLNLQDIKGLTIEHLRTWEKNSEAIDRKLNENARRMSRLRQEVTGMNPVGAL